MLDRSATRLLTTGLVGVALLGSTVSLWSGSDGENAPGPVLQQGGAADAETRDARCMVAGFAEGAAAPLRSAVNPAQNAPGPLEVVPAELVGRIVEASGQGIAGASVSARPVDGGEITTALSGARGGFRFAGLEAGGYELRIDAAGFRQSLVPGTLQIVAGAQHDCGEFELVPGFGLAGRVSGPDGAPCVAARVVLRTGSGGSVVATTRVDAAGRFVLEQLPAGPHQVEVLAPGLRPWRAEQVDPATERHLEVGLRRGLALAVRVVDAVSAEVLDAAELQLARRSARSLVAGTRDAERSADGVARFTGLEAGDYRIEAVTPGHAGARTAWLRLRDDEPQQSIVELELQPERSVQLRVVDARRGRPVDGARVELRSGNGGDEVVPVRFVTDASGGVRVHAVAAAGEEWQLAVRAPGFRSCESVRVDSRRKTLEIEMEAAAVLHGRVIDMPAAMAAATRVVARGPAGDAEVRVDQAGRYRFDDLPAAGYRIAVRVGVGGGAESSEPAEEIVELADGEAVRRDLRFDRAGLGSLRGQVHTAGGMTRGLRFELRPSRPIAAALGLRGPLELAPSAAAGDCGFVAEALLPGSYELVVGGAVGAQLSELHVQTVQVRAGAPTRVAIDLQTAVVRGAVSLPTGGDGAGLDGTLRIWRVGDSDQVAPRFVVAVRGGRFGPFDVEPGAHRVEIRVPGRQLAVAMAHVTAAGARWALRAGASL